MGDLCYADKDKFKEPWCKLGDWVIFARYAGSRLPIEGGEVRILNDDEVLGTIKIPNHIFITFNIGRNYARRRKKTIDVGEADMKSQLKLI